MEIQVWIDALEIGSIVNNRRHHHHHHQMIYYAIYSTPCNLQKDKEDSRMQYFDLKTKVLYRTDGSCSLD